jgi:hypothetical protein
MAPMMLSSFCAFALAFSAAQTPAAAQAPSAAPAAAPPSPTMPKVNIPADYVIVGGGTAGCVLAARLCTGLPEARIVMLERAAPRSPEAVCSHFLHRCIYTSCFLCACPSLVSQVFKHTKTQPDVLYL